MDCLEFRRAAGADPQHLEPAARGHADACARCSEYHRQLLALDKRVLAALRVPLPGQDAAPVRPGLSSLPWFDRRRWLALAASIVAGVLVGTLLWVGAPRNSLADDVLEHLAHEPESLVAANRPEDAAVLRKVLERGGIRVRPEAGLVSYANSCRFRGRTVPHLVVQGDGGPVTVMVLRNERPAAPVSFSEQGYSGRIVPAGPGSIAVVGAADDADLEQVTARVLAAVEWLQD
jgi:hypothetical protein